MTAHFDEIKDGGGQGRNHWYHVTLREGRNREVRRLWGALDLPVSRLQRVRYGSISLPRWLKPGKWRDLPPDQLRKLQQDMGLKADSQLMLKASKPGRARKSR